MQKTVSGEASFKAYKDQFMVGPSASGYRLAYSADNINFTPYEKATPANEVLHVNGAMMYGWYKLSGNTSNDIPIIL